MSSIVSVSVIPGFPTGVLPPLAGGIVIATLILAGPGATDDKGDQVSAGGVVLGALHDCVTVGVWIEVVLVSAGALCARCVDRVGPYDLEGPLEADEA